MNKNKTKKQGQGSLEYLIIIAAVLAIASISILFITHSFSGAKKHGSISKCQTAASRCYNEKSTSANAQCNYCKDACSGLSACKMIACMEGKPEKVQLVESTGLCIKTIFFDDFNSSELNSSLWQVDPNNKGYNAYEIKNGELIIGGENGEVGLIESKDKYNGGVIEFRAKVVSNTPSNYKNGDYNNVASVNFDNNTEDFYSSSGFNFHDYIWPTVSNIAAGDTLQNKNPNKVNINENQGLVEKYSYNAFLKKKDVDAYDGYHTYTIVWKNENGVNVNDFYVDCIKIGESNSTYQSPKKIHLRGNYKQLHIDWIKVCNE